MGIKQSISRPINADKSGVKAVVNEASDGIQAVPSELVIKAADDSTFTQISENTPMPVRIISGAIELVNVSLQSGTIVPSSGTAYTPINNVVLTFVVTGSSTSRLVVFELADPITGKYVAATVFGVANPAKMVTQTTGGNDDTPEGWQIEIPAGWTFRSRVSSVSGGTVSVKGKAVRA